MADIIKSMEVSVIPFAVYKKAKVCRSDQKKKKSRVCSIHKLKINLYKPEHYPKHTDITDEDWQETMKVRYLRKLEDAIQKHMTMLCRIRGIKVKKVTGLKAGNDTKNNDSASGKQTQDDDDSASGKQNQDDDDDDDDDDDSANGKQTQDDDDEGLGAEKRKKQAADKDYEESSEDEKNETLSTSGVDDDTEMDSEDENEEVSKEETREPKKKEARDICYT